MADPRFQRLQALFAAAAELAEAEWQPFAAAQCADDPALAEQLLRLLARERRAALLSEAALADGLASALRAALPSLNLEGRTLGSYRIEGVIGDGGMGRVYRAVRCDGKVEQQVAIKLVRGELLQPELLRRFSAEQQTLAALSHPGICRFIDAGSLDDGTPYVVMELVDGRPLLQYCDEQRLTIEQRLQLFRRVLAAVEHAHRNLIVHRDIKSANVLVDRDGQPKLLDFGIAKPLTPFDGDATLTSARYFTPANAAPEQLRGDAITVACDVYALGLLGYELLVGRPPYDLAGRSAADIERCLLHVPPPLASQRAAEVEAQLAQARGLPSAQALARRLAGDLDTILATCLRKATHERYGDVQQLDDELVRLLAGRPIRARGHDRLYRARKFVVRNRLPVALASLSALIFAIAMVVVVMQTFALTEQRNRALIERDRAQQLVQLLKGAFIAADPAQSASADMRARDVLGAARPQLDALFDAQPATFASLAQTLAEVEFALGLDRRAAELSERAASAARRAGASAVDSAAMDAMSALAWAGAGQYEQAREALQRAAPHAETLPVWHLAQARLGLHTNAADASISASRRAIALFGDAGPDDNLAVLARWQLADALRLNDQHDAAIDALRNVLAWQRAALRAGHPGITRTRLRLAESLRRAGDAAAAIGEVETVLPEIQQLYGRHSSAAGLAHAILALAHAKLGADATAIEHHRHALEAWTQAFGDTHTNTLRSHFNLAEALAKDPARLAEAEQHYRTAVHGAERVPDRGPDAAIYFRLRLATLLHRLGRAHDALQALDPVSALDRMAQLVPINREDYLRVLAAVRADAGCSAQRGPSEACAAAAALLDEPRARASSSP